MFDDGDLIDCYFFGAMNSRYKSGFQECNSLLLFFLVVKIVYTGVCFQ